MATYTTFSSLKTDVYAFIERGQSVTNDETVHDQIPRLINAAERKIAQRIKLQGEIEVLVDPTGLRSGVSVLTKPDRWRQTVSLNFGSGTGSNTRNPLLPRSYEFLRTYWPDPTQTDFPLFYSDYSYSSWLVAPTPDATYPLEVNAYCQPVLLDDSNQSNFLSNFCPNLLLYETLLECAPFLKDDSRIPTWKDKVAEEYATLDGQDIQKIFDRTAARERP